MFSSCEGDVEVDVNTRDNFQINYATSLPRLINCRLP